jgi:hypothetical protein
VILSHHHTLLRKHRVGKWQIKHIIPNVGAIVGFLSPIFTYVNKVNNNKKTYKEAMNYLKMRDISNYSKKREIQYL